MSPNRFLITDTNNDGKPDIVHFNGGNKGVSVFIGDGQGNFGTKRKDTYADWTGLTTINPDPATHRLADINGDGLLDWIAFNQTAGGASLYMHGKAQGAELGYDGASNRRTATAFDDATGQRFTEYYTFDTANRLINTYRLSQVLNPTTGQLETKQNYTSERAYDPAGRVVMFKTYSSPGVLRDTTFTTYDDNNRLLKRETFLPNKETPSYTVDYSAEGSYAPDGRVLKYTVKVPGATNTYTTTYLAFEGYQQLKEIGNSSYFDSGKTNFYYDVNGRLTKVTDANDNTKYRTFIYNAQGQILQKTDYRNKNQYYQYENGNPIGSHGALVGADFDYNYTPVSEHYPAATPSQYVANQGDTLQMVALAVYGDAKLWYLIADANGLDASASLKTGQVLTVPNQITNIHNDSTTFKPYNPNEIIGDTTPRLPLPVIDDDSSLLAQIIITVIVIVVAYYTTQWWLVAELPAYLAPVVGAIAGNVAGQAAGVALGVQEEFSWASLATAALSAGVASYGTLNISGVAQLDKALTAMVVNAGSQGISIATGQQEHFSWASTATAGVATAIVSGLSGEAGANTNTSTGATLVSRLTGGLLGKSLTLMLQHNGAAEWTQVAGDTFGNALGGALVEAMKPTEPYVSSGIDWTKPLSAPSLFPASGDNGLLAGYGGNATSSSQGASTPASYPYQAQSGDTVWGLTGGDPTLIGEFRRINGLKDADTIYAGKAYQVPTRAEDANAAQASFDQQAALWQTKDEAGRQAGAAQAASSAGAASTQSGNSLSLAPFALQVGIGETIVSIGSRLLGQAVGGVTMILTGGDVGAGRAVEEAFVYEPRTPAGQLSTRAAGEVLAPVAKGMEWVRTMSGDAGFSIGNALLGPEGGAVLGATFATAPDAILTFLAPGARGAFVGASESVVRGGSWLARETAPLLDRAAESYMVNNGLLLRVVEEGANSSIKGVPINGATRNTPLGFESESQFLNASKELNDVMAAHGINDATVGVRGSSVTGFGGNPRSLTFEKPFGPASDIDLFVESTQAVNAFKKQPSFVHPDKMIDAFPGLDVWSNRWSDILGRPVSPAAWKPGALPPTPAILVKGTK